jgi:hypothetical protein
VIESLLGGVSTAAVLVGTGTGGGIDNTNMMAQAGEMDVDSFLQSGGVAMPMGVSGQAGKSKPITNIIFREDGIDISRNSKTGNVIAEILVQKAGTKQEEYNDENLMSVITSFSAPYPLGKFCYVFFYYNTVQSCFTLCYFTSLALSMII